MSDGSKIDAATNKSTDKNLQPQNKIIKFLCKYTTLLSAALGTVVSISACAKSTNQYLEGDYAPVKTELHVQNLPVIGSIPKDLQGVYMRNGPNPMYPPISYTYPLDGDGMIHAIYLHNGKASYKNKYIHTKGLMAEKRANRAIYGGVQHPIMPPLDLVGKNGDKGPFKNVANIHIIRHANQYLALYEGRANAYEMTKELDTKGIWIPSNIKNALDVNAHSKLDPVTKDLYMFMYTTSAIVPQMIFYKIDKHGKLQDTIAVDKKYPSMIHDFAMTKNHIVFFDYPAIFDINRAKQGKSYLNWDPSKKTRVAIIDRHGKKKVAWLDTETFFAYHIANSFEDHGKIYVDYIRYNKLNLDQNSTLNRITNSPHLYRAVIDLTNNTVVHHKLDNRAVEFPRINDKYNSLAYNYIYTPGAPKRSLKSLFQTDPFSLLVKYDVKNNTSTIHDFGSNAELGEAVFSPRPNSTAEDDGYVMLFVYNNQKKESTFVILDAKDITKEPLAIVKLPQRIPHGLHGTWMEAQK